MSVLWGTAGAVHRFPRGSRPCRGFSAAEELLETHEPEYIHDLGLHSDDRDISTFPLERLLKLDKGADSHAGHIVHATEEELQMRESCVDRLFDS
jgi:hypothetical protein